MLSASSRKQAHPFCSRNKIRGLFHFFTGHFKPKRYIAFSFAVIYEIIRKNFRNHNLHSALFKLLVCAGIYIHNFSEKTFCRMRKDINHRRKLGFKKTSFTKAAAQKIRNALKKFFREGYVNKLIFFAPDARICVNIKISYKKIVPSVCC